MFRGTICSGGQETSTAAASTPSGTGRPTSRSRWGANGRIEGEGHDDLSSRPAQGQAHSGDRWRHGMGREIAGEYAKLGAEVYICGRLGAVVAETARELAET